MSFLGIHLFSSDFLFSNCLWNGGRSNGIPHFGVEVTSVGNYSQGGGPCEGFEKRWRTTTTSVRGV